MLGSRPLFGLACVAVLLLPLTARAQRRGMGGSKEADWNAVMRKEAPTGVTISAKDFERVSPYKALADKKKDLKLSDAQFVTLTDAHKALLAANAERFAMLDSLKKAVKPNSSSEPTTEDEVRLVIARESLQQVVQDIRVSFDEASKTVSGLDDAQKAPATELLAKNTTEMQEMLREKMGGRGGPGGGPPAAGRGGRPPA